MTWKKEEIEFVKENYKDMTVKELSNYLNKSNKSVRAKIERLGISLKELNRIEVWKWTESDIDFLKCNYKKMLDKEIAVILFGDDSYAASARVFRKRHILGLEKPKRGTKYNYKNNCEYVSRFENGEKIYEHIENAEIKIGRKIIKGEVVHHIDGEKRNNDPNNLFVCKDKKEHKIIHSQLQKVAMDLVKSGFIKFNEKEKRYYATNKTT